MSTDLSNKGPPVDPFIMQMPRKDIITYLVGALNVRVPTKTRTTVLRNKLQAYVTRGIITVYELQSHKEMTAVAEAVSNVITGNFMKTHTRAPVKTPTNTKF